MTESIGTCAMLPADGSIDALSVATIRGLAIDMVEAASSGHPGAPIGLAPLAHILFTKHFKAVGTHPLWMARDRFVLSNGHACALQYAILHLLKYSVSIEDLKSFRQLHSKTPGHPECHVTPGVEVTTGPLGQGIANAVGLAIAQSHLAATFNRENFEIFSNFTYCIVGDGCMQEGVAAEAFSLAGHLKLFRLIVIYDDNGIQIDGNTDLAFSEDVDARMRSYGFMTFVVENGDCDLQKISEVLEAARTNATSPSFIRVRTTIGAGSKVEGTEKAHGSPLGAEEAAACKKKYFGKEVPSFHIPEKVEDFYTCVLKRNDILRKEWENLFAAYLKQFPKLASDIECRLSGESLCALNLSDFPSYSPLDAAAATRKLSEVVLNVIAPTFLPALIGGSADLTASNLTRWKDAVDYGASTPSGRYIRFGVREHAMAAICNGIAGYGHDPVRGGSLLIPFAATFLNFITYAWGAVRLSALSHHQILYVMTHDSIGLGEDGPTHQPIEALAALRALPNTLTFRPADGNEVSGAYYAALTLHRTGPSVLCLSRQNLPQLANTNAGKVSFGAYILKQVSKPSVILVGTGSEVSILMEAASQMEFANVVSMPCMELFERQSKEYKQSIFPENVPVISLEASSTFGWSRYAVKSIGIDTFGASGPASKLYSYFGITVDAVVASVDAVLRK